MPGCCISTFTPRPIRAVKFAVSLVPQRSPNRQHWCCSARGLFHWPARRGGGAEIILHSRPDEVLPVRLSGAAKNRCPLCFRQVLRRYSSVSFSTISFPPCFIPSTVAVIWSFFPLFS